MMEDEDSILLTTLLDPLERSIFHDSDGEEDKEEELVLFEDNEEEKNRFGLNDSLPIRFDKENMNPSPAVSVSKRSFLSTSKRNTPLRDIGNQMKKSLTGSHKKVATKFLELGARIHSLLEESMMSTTSIEREEIHPKKEEVEEMGEAEKKDVLDSDEDDEIVSIVSKTLKKTDSFPIRIRDPVSETLSSDLKTMSRHRFDDSAILSSDVVRPEYDGSHVILSLKSGGSVGNGAAFSEIRREEEEEKKKTPEEKTPDRTLKNVTTPQSTMGSTTMVLWNSSPELKFSPGNSTLQDHSLEHLKRKFLMRTERRRRRRKAIRKMLSIPTVLEVSRATPSAPSSSIFPVSSQVEKEEESTPFSSHVKKQKSPSPVSVKEQKTPPSEKEMTASPFPSRIVEKEDPVTRIIEEPLSKENVSDDSWRDVIKRSVATMQKLDKIFHQRKEEEKKCVREATRRENETRRNVPDIRSVDRKYQPTKNNEFETKCWWEDNMDQNRNKSSRMMTGLDLVLSNNDVSETKKGRQSNVSETKKGRESNNVEETQSSIDMAPTPDAKPTPTHESSIDMSSLIVRGVRSLSLLSRVSLYPQSINLIRITSLEIIPLECYEILIVLTHRTQVLDDDDERKEILGALPRELSFRVGQSSSECGMLNAGTVEVVPLDIRSNCVSSLVRVELRISPRQDAPRAILEHLRHWNFSFAIEDETMRKSRPLTCRSNGGADDWFGSDMFANNGETENAPICRAIEIDVRPNSVTRVRVSLTQSHGRKHRTTMPPVMCPALITVKARRVVKQNSRRSSPLFRTTIPLYLTDNKPALLTNGKVGVEDDRVRLHFARKLSPVLECA